MTNTSNNMLTYEKAMMSVNVLEKRLGEDVELWKMFSVENVEVPAGRIVITNGANDILDDTEGLEYVRKCLARHINGDFGDISHYEGWKDNILAVWTNEGRVLSRYKTPANMGDIDDLYIITEGIALSNYHHTTIMLVSEY